MNGEAANTEALATGGADAAEHGTPPEDPLALAAATEPETETETETETDPASAPNGSLVRHTRKEKIARSPRGPTIRLGRSNT